MRRKTTVESYVSVPLPRCACGAEAVAVKPGSDGEVEAGIMTRRAVPDQGWCLRCWPATAWAA